MPRLELPCCLRLIAVVALCCFPGFVTSTAAQDMQAAQELLDLIQQMKSADDPCPYLPQIRAKVNQMANSDPDVYEAIKPSLEEMNGMDLRCDAPASSPNARGAVPSDAAATNSPTPPAPADVRFAAGDTRMLTDDEYSQLRQGLRYDPPSAALNIGGSARSNLVDATGAILATVAVQWVRTDNASGRAPLGRFHIMLSNRSSCLFSSDAVMALPNSPNEIWGVNSGTWLTWVTPNQPLPGQSKTFSGSATLRSAYSAFAFRPLNPENALSQCRTAKPLPQSSDTN